MTQSGLAPRRAALTLLNDVTIDARLLSEVLPRRLRNLAADDRARAQRLAVTTLRVLDRADRMLGPYLRQKPPVPVLNVLRLGVTEICEDGSAAHGVVNDLVELVRKDAKNARLSGLVNAVLRKVARDADKWSTLPVPRLPRWLRKPLLADYGKQVVAAIEAAHAAAAPLDLSVKTNAAKVAEAL
ncbi:MAG TPA: 16S rRNA methyltransferase, partial [Aliiroseovarius sp.]|nr:16S rRNA methyltransferase [Aliiroseovarius sp.]